MNRLLGTTLLAITTLAATAPVEAVNVVVPRLPVFKDCPDGSKVLDTEVCPSVNGVAQPGATGATLTGTSVNIGSTIGGVVGAAFGGNFAGASAQSGASRYALSESLTGQAAAAGGSNWNAWVALGQVNVGYSFQPLQSGGTAGLVLGGVDYTIGNSVVLGLALSFERTRIDTAYNGGNINGNGYSVAPYVGWQINRSWLLDATLGFGRTRLDSTDNSVAGGITGSNTSDRTLGSIGLTYGQAVGRWNLTGKGSLIAVENRFSAFTQSNNNFVGGSTTHTTQLRLGANAAYNAGNFSPFAGVAYIYDVQAPTQAALAGQNAANDRDAWQVRAGFNFRTAGALYGGLVLSTEVGRSQVKNDQILFNLGARF
jgi:hypothetical protein